mmetsp:Transcript_32968/g.102259  ORF Transcript_32968/g.102259 Transcript_32968/m.102259 type:complete len:211 (+) Transcript_32968:85-717(+)
MTGASGRANDRPPHASLSHHWLRARNGSEATRARAGGICRTLKAAPNAQPRATQTHTHTHTHTPGISAPVRPSQQRGNGLLQAPYGVLDVPHLVAQKGRRPCGLRLELRQLLFHLLLPTPEVAMQFQHVFRAGLAASFHHALDELVHVQDAGLVVVEDVEELLHAPEVHADLVQESHHLLPPYRLQELFPGQDAVAVSVPDREDPKDDLP